MIHKHAINKKKKRENKGDEIPSLSIYDGSTVLEKADALISHYERDQFSGRHRTLQLMFTFHKEKEMCKKLDKYRKVMNQLLIKWIGG